MLKELIYIVLKWMYRKLSQTSKKSPKKTRKRVTRRTSNRKLKIKQVHVIDGDTIQGMIKRKSEKIRLILVDTPETSHPSLGSQPFGKEAKQFVTRKINRAKRVEVELHGNESRDRYGRLIGHVFVDGENLNQLLLTRGYARIAYKYSKYAYEDVYHKAEAQAKKKRLGIWSVKGYVQQNGFHPEVIKGKNRLAK